MAAHLRFVLVAFIAGSIGVYACTGDDPTPVGGTSSGGASSGSSSGASGGDPNESGSLTLVASNEVLSVLPGATVDLNVTVQRANGFAGPVKITVSGLPGGVTVDKEVTVTADQTTAPVTLRADEDAKVGMVLLEIKAESLKATIGAKTTKELVVRGPAGSIDTSFATRGFVIDYPILPVDGVFLRDGSMVVGGSAAAGSGFTDEYAAVHILPDGKVDKEWGDKGIFRATLGGSELAEPYVRKVSIDENEKISLIGQASVDGELRFGIVRLDKKGFIDPDLLTTGRGDFKGAARAGQDHGGSTFLIGFASDIIGGRIAVSKVNRTGFDGMFADGGTAMIDQFISAPNGAIQPDGKILVVGRGGNPGVDEDALCVRLTSDGKLDPEFNKSGTAGIFLVKRTDLNESFNAVATLPDGNILLVGDEAISAGGDYRPLLRVLKSDGTVESSFNTTTLPHVGDANTSNSALRVAVQRDGAFIVSGAALVGGQSRGVIRRVLRGGLPDPDFHAGAPVIIDYPGLPDLNTTVHNIAIDNHDRLVVFYQRAVLRFWL